MLKCEAVHKGYEKQQLEAWNNIAKAQLNLQFKPWVETCVFNEAKIGQLGIVTCMFRSNPKPTEGQWNMETITIPIGKQLFIYIYVILVKSFFSVNYGLSIITSNVHQIISVMKRKTLVFPEK